MVGALILLFSNWLSGFHGLPRGLLIFVGVVNLTYGSYSTSLASQAKRGLKFILFLVAANFFWTPACFYLAIKHIDTITIFGLLHLIGEGIYVSGLASLEWRWSKFLVRTQNSRISSTPLEENHYLEFNKGFAIFRLPSMQAYAVIRRKTDIECYRKSSNQK